MKTSYNSNDKKSKQSGLHLTIQQVRQEVKRRARQKAPAWNVMQLLPRSHQDFCPGCDRKMQKKQSLYFVADLGFRCQGCFLDLALGERYWMGHPSFDVEQFKRECEDPLNAQLEKELSRGRAG